MAPSWRKVTSVVRARSIAIFWLLAIGCAACESKQEPGVSIELTIDGGFAAIPGLAKSIVLDPAHLPAEQGAKLLQLVNAAVAEYARGEAKQVAPVPDARHYRIAIQLAGVQHELVADDPAVPPAFDALMDFVKENGRR